MAIKNIDARIKHKRDTAANWDKYNPVLLNGEVIIVDTASGEVRYKTGDGVKNYKQLPFDDEAIKAQINEKLTKPTGNAGQLLGFTENNVIGAIDFQGGGGLYSDKFTGTLTTSWTSSNGKFYQQITVPGMTSDQQPLVFPNWSSAKINEQKAWNSLEAGVESFNGYVRFYAPKATTTAVSFTLLYKK